MEIEIRALRPDDERSSFSSGDVDLDRFFRKYAGQNQFRLHVGTTYVASSAGSVVDYVTIAPGAIVIDRLPRRERQRLPAYPLPILRLARLAVAATHQGHGIGTRLVRSSRITDSWGMRPRLEQDPTFRRTLDWYGLVYVHRGSGTFYDPHDSRPVRAGDLICLFPGVPHAYGPDSDERWDEINIDFSGPAFAAWQGPGMLDPDEPVRRLEPIGYWLSRFNELVGQAFMWVYAAFAFHQSSVSIGMILGSQLGAVLAERYGWRTGFFLFGTAGLVGAAFVATVGLCTTKPVLLLAMAVFGLCKGCYDAGIFASLFDQIELEARASAAGIMNTVGWGGGALGPPFVGLATLWHPSK